MPQPAYPSPATGECHAVTRHSLGLPPHAPAPCAGHALLAACGEEETEAGVCLFLPLAPPRSAAPPPAEGRNGTNRSSNHSNAISVYNLSDFALQSRFTTNDDGANDDGDDDPCGGVCPQGVCDSVDDAGKPECGDCAECMAGGGRRRRLRRRWLTPVVEEEEVGSGEGGSGESGWDGGSGEAGSGDGGSGGAEDDEDEAARALRCCRLPTDSGRRLADAAAAAAAEAEAVRAEAAARRARRRRLSEVAAHISLESYEISSRTIEEADAAPRHAHEG